MIALLNWRVWAACLMFVVFAATNLVAYRSGKANIRAAWDAEKVVQLNAEKEAEIENRRIESKRQTNVIAAQSAATARNTVLRADADRARSESDRLRDAIATASADLPSRSPVAQSEYGITASILLSDCSRIYQELAGKADAIDSDKVMLQRAWPKN